MKVSQPNHNGDSSGTHIDASVHCVREGKAVGSLDFFISFPGIGEEAVAWFFDKGIDLIGLESPSVNAQKHLEIHKLLFEKETGIVESLANVDKIGSKLFNCLQCH